MSRPASTNAYQTNQGINSRRDLLRAAAIGSLSMSAMATAFSQSGQAQTSTSGATTREAGQVKSDFIFYDDPVEEFRAHFRIERDLVEEGTTLTWYHMLVFVIPTESRPLPVVRYEGIEYSYFRHLGDHNYRIHAHNLSYPRDLNTGAFTDTFLNPVTDEQVSIPPTLLLNDPGTVASPIGYRNLSGDGSYTRGYRLFRREDHLIKKEQVRTAPPDWPALHLENSVAWVDEDLFQDQEITSLPTFFAGGYTYPYPSWLNMGDIPGHMQMMFDGKKIYSTDDLPSEFLEKAISEYPELLEPRWGEFDRPIPFEI